MNDLGIQGYAGRLFQELSQGEQRLVLVARALVKRPDLLLLDEPCQGLDDRNRDRVLALVDSIGQQMETSVVYVTHDAGQLPQIITHVLRLEEGKTVECGELRPANSPSL
jgi:molybdate transport system ATP-binding protein